MTNFGIEISLNHKKERTLFIAENCVPSFRERAINELPAEKCALSVYFDKT